MSSITPAKRRLMAVGVALLLTLGVGVAAAETASAAPPVTPQCWYKGWFLEGGVWYYGLFKEPC